MKEVSTVLFLYSRLPDYFYKCIRFYVNRYEAKAVIIRYEEDGNTNYQFEADDRIEMYYKKDVDVPAVIKAIRPSAIFLSGWSDKLYKRAAGRYARNVPIILGLDNPWEGTMKQYLLSVFSRVFIRNVYNRVWVAGEQQYKYARRLGFGKAHILRNLYAADCGKFYESAGVAMLSKEKNYPHVLVYLGRLVDYKRPDKLAALMDLITRETDGKWKLVMAGEGPLKAEIQHQGYKNVEIVDFVKPDQMPLFYSNAGAFCLPSNGEHWGVSVQEAAAAGLPLILSDTVQSGKVFLKDQENGFVFRTDDMEDLKRVLVKLMSKTDDDLLKMGKISRLLSKSIDHEKWAASLHTGINEYYAS